ncbi:MAG TPA: CPBP family intramembrane glutamic endopeptidase [Anaerolineaceae bacterium]
MTAKAGIGIQEDQARRQRAGWQVLAQKSGLFVLILICAIVVFILGDNHFNAFPTNRNVVYESATTAFFLAAAIVMRRIPRFNDYWQIAYAFFAAAAVILVTTLTVGFRDALFRGIGILPNTNPEAAAAKVFEALMTIGTILLLSRLAGMKLESLYVKRGNLKWGLLIGLGTLLNFMTSSLMFFVGRFSSLDRFGSAILWGIVFSLCNGFLEELWLRGQFLKKLAPALGMGTTIVLTSLWFGMYHVSGIMYMQPQAIPFYMINTFTFAAAWGYLMHRTDSWIGPGLMHAASDFFLFIAMLGSA